MKNVDRSSWNWLMHKVAKCRLFLISQTASYTTSQKHTGWANLVQKLCLYVKDRFIGEAIRSIFDIMDFTAKENIPGLLLFIDFQKAFDSVEWEFLIESLKKFNFGRDFLQWVKTFITAFKAVL